ncbi:tyrosine--tRNA ligase [symbiont of Argiope bruennichi]|uniref:tyrosine--tRNA ligase n=1 Tax=symbiont of Argiope bruennichi TaxID=2810479 RepID=UPI003DA64A61
MATFNIKEEIKLLFSSQVNIVSEVTNKNKFQKCIDGTKGIYCGFDPTSNRLHLGNLIQLNLLKRLQKLGCKPIVIIGGATAQIGDPSGKKVERKILEKNVVEKNKEQIKTQISKFFSNNIKIFDNFYFYNNTNILNFLRDVGKDFNVNNLLKKEVIKTRLEVGISFTEFSYQLLQAYDFFYLYKEHQCYGQIGGSDQWGNIISGIDYCNKKFSNCNAFGITFNLLTDSNNNKFGKSEDGAIFLDESWKIYNYLLSIDDKLIDQVCYLLMDWSLVNIKKMLDENKLNLSVKLAQKELTKNVISYLFSEENFKNYQEINEMLFYWKDKINFSLLRKYFSFLPSIQLNWNEIRDKKIIDILVLIEHFGSKTKIRQLIKQKALLLNKKIVKEDDNLKNYITQDNKINDFYYILIQAGKKNFFVIRT